VPFDPPLDPAPHPRGVSALGLGVAALALVALLAMLLLLTRGTPVKSVRSFEAGGPPAPAEAGFVPLIEALVPTHLETGHHIELLNDGDGTFPRLLEDMRAARESILMQAYFWKAGSLSDTIGAVLAERARAGVRVLALFDDFGADVPAEYLDMLREAGVMVAVLRPVSLFELRKSQQRSHLRVVVVDRAIGYTGGFGIADEWLGDGRTLDQWRETNVRFTGPAVAQLAGSFAAGWAEATGVLLVADPASAQPAEDAGDSWAGLVYTSPTTGSTPAERLIALSFAAARERLYVANAYFVPDDDFRAMLIAAAQRGVDVRVLAPSAHTDVPVVRHAGRASYAELLEGGVRIWEYEPTMMHAKTLVADGLWSLVGTMNIDNRSLALNDEVTLAALDRTLGSVLEAAFLEDLEHSVEILAPDFARRGMRQRIKENASVLLSRWL
jgi:cardiolipin synthase A/B